MSSELCRLGFLSDGALWPWIIVLQQINFVAASLSMLYTCISLVHAVQNAGNSNPVMLYTLQSIEGAQSMCVLCHISPFYNSLLILEHVPCDCFLDGAYPHS